MLTATLRSFPRETRIVVRGPDAATGAESPTNVGLPGAATPDGTSSDGGCGCSASSAGGAGAAAFATVTAALALAHRRRRRAGA